MTFRGTGRGDHWVEPQLVAQTKFTEWTLDGLLRHPVYLGLRSDKLPVDVSLPDRRPANESKRLGGRTSRTPFRAGLTAKRTKTAKARVPKHPEPRAAQLHETLDELEQQKRRGTLELSDGSRVPVGNLEKIFWPDVGITKGELVRYYLRMAPCALPVVEARPLVMKSGFQTVSMASRSTSIARPTRCRMVCVWPSSERNQTNPTPVFRA